MKEKTACRGAILLLHEIYGVNRFISEAAADYEKMGFDVFCPNLLNRPPFLYSETDEAYAYFRAHVGFGRHEKIGAEIGALRKKYENVFVIGYSVGATVAWLCSENPALSGVVCCYGSRVRDYLSVNPVCPTLMIFARHDSFDVGGVAEKLKDKPFVNCFIRDAAHGFMDKYHAAYNECAAQQTQKQILAFLSENLHMPKAARYD